MEVYWECETEKMADFQSWLTESKMLHLVTNPINSLREALYGASDFFPPKKSKTLIVFFLFISRRKSRSVASASGNSHRIGVHH